MKASFKNDNAIEMFSPPLGCSLRSDLTHERDRRAISNAYMKDHFDRQSMIRSDFRLYTPSAVPMLAPSLKGDVAFTHFEATVAEKGQPNETVPGEGNSLAPPEATDALKDMGFNLLSLANNHSWGLRAPVFKTPPARRTA